MKKYKHKTTGNIAIETLSEKNYKVSEPKNFTIPKWIVENSNEWEEIKEKQYEIIEATTSGYGFKISKVKRISDSIEFKIGDKVNNPKLQTEQPFTIKEFCFDCNNEHILALGGNGGINITKIEHYKELPYKILKFCPIEGTIYSVERISDGEIFTIGDKCQPINYKNPGIIEKFEFVLEDQLRIQGRNERGRSWYLSIDTIKKIKTPLFITFDNVEIFEENNVFGVLPKANWQTNFYGGNGIPAILLVDKFTNELKSKAWLYFSSKNAANRYIELNKPEYSLQQILNILAGFDKEINEYVGGDYSKFIEKYK